MRRPICLLATAALLAMFCGCQSMPMLAQPEGPMPPVDTGNGVPETLPDVGESTIVDNSTGPEAQVIPEPEMPVVPEGNGMVYGGGGYCEGGGCGSSCGSGGCGQACYPYHRHGLHLWGFRPPRCHPVTRD